LEVQCSELDVESSVFFLGPKFGEEKAAAYRNASAFILPSLSEGLPMVVLEAWAYARPVLMTGECNLPEGFEANAALRIGTSSAAIAQGLRELFHMNDGARVAVGLRGLELVKQKFLWPEIGREMRRVCDWVVNGGSPPSSVRFD
jgi:poly(glycerol-phosphate) alpha-glucosyltransferase